jgi:DNA-binding transcriptional regulator YiaG
VLRTIPEREEAFGSAALALFDAQHLHDALALESQRIGVSRLEFDQRLHEQVSLIAPIPERQRAPGKRLRNFRSPDAAFVVAGEFSCEKPGYPGGLPSPQSAAKKPRNFPERLGGAVKLEADGLVGPRNVQSWARAPEVEDEQTSQPGHAFTAHALCSAGLRPSCQKCYAEPVTPDDIKLLRKELGCTARDLATTLGIEQKEVLAWEAGELFPTKRFVDQMQTIRDKGPSAVVRAAKGKNVGPTERVSDPAFWAVVKKLLLHPALFDQVSKLAERYEDEKK